MSHRERLRVTVAGLKHGENHAELIAGRDDMELVAVCDLDEDKARAVLTEHAPGCNGVFTDYDAMLDSVEPDISVIATPVSCHASMATAALERNIHVFLEKPLAVNLEEARDIGQAAERSRGICQIGYEKLSSPLIREVQRLIDTGQLGNLVVMWSHEFREITNPNAWRFQRGHTWGLFFDCQVHEFSIMTKLAGSDFHRVCAFGAPQGRRGPVETDLPETVTASIEYKNGVRASAAFSQVSQTHKNDMFGFVGTDGRMVVDPFFPEGPGSLNLYTRKGLYKTETVVDGAKASHGHIGFTEQYDYFVRSVQEGAPVVADLANAIDTQRLMAAFELSIAEGRIVTRDEFEL